MIVNTGIARNGIEAAAHRDLVEQQLRAAMLAAVQQLDATVAHSLGELLARWEELVTELVVPAVLKSWGPAPGLADYLFELRTRLAQSDIVGVVWLSRQQEQQEEN